MSVFYPRVTRRGAALDWVKFDAELARDGSVDTVDKALYAAIGSFVDADTRESPETVELDPNNIPPWVPTRKRLAECIGKSVDTVDRSTKRLEVRGLLRVHRQPDPNNPRRMLPSEYELLDHHIWDERAAQRAADRAARRTGGSQDGSSEGGRTGAATPGRMDAATPGRTGAAVKDLGEVVEEEGEEEAPSARSAGDVRRTGAGSSARTGANSGSAAADKTGALTGESNTAGVPGQRAADKPKLTREEAAAVRAVEALLPAALVAKLPHGHIPTVNRTSVLDALESRSLEQLAARITRRWELGGLERDHLDGLLRSPVGAALALIAPTPYCPDLGCEDGALIGKGGARTNEDCLLCLQRKADRRRDRLAGRPVPTGKPGKGGTPAPECLDCQRPFYGRVPEDQVCGACKAEAADSCAALTAQWAAEEEPPEEEPVPEEDQVEEEAVEAAGAQRPEVDEETARLHAQILAENPWMARYQQQPATAPF
ncbi:helix-turn-helix domain-containing protein [Kitasatospora sp. A2-31]|uniref:helix-turn-helix domain-containing protein n=1 Tax=Kitasatospora sp. A2-31 TaxID=2916414 RepID=UPI001EEACF90|nr:helix-turn-helix domain-containing protein [Kitasatospora sp. A2-31]MCG6496620.1 helix-turn-helix domain-containing protein [Kitasatospora sp. A2-31]